MAQTLAVPEKNLRPPASYPELREKIRRTITGGQRRTFWEVGRWIDLYLKNEKQSAGRAPYGEKVVAKLARDLDYSPSLFYDALRFARQNPILHPGVKLTTKHLRILLRVTDGKQKHVLASQAQKYGWGTRRLEKQVQKKTFRLEPRKGKLHHYRIVERNGKNFLDLGFRDWRALPPETKTLGLRPGDRVEGDSFKNLRKKSGAGEPDLGLYTYRAEVMSLPDADTHWLFIDKGFGSFREDKIRLRGIDAAEMTTRAGRRAKQFVGRILGFSEKAGAQPVEVLITTTKVPDKWDRYLVDLYFEKDGREIYLNRLLLDEGLAVPYEE